MEADGGEGATFAAVDRLQRGGVVPLVVDPVEPVVEPAVPEALVPEVVAPDAAMPPEAWLFFFAFFLWWTVWWLLMVDLDAVVPVAAMDPPVVP